MSLDDKVTVHGISREELDREHAEFEKEYKRLAKEFRELDDMDFPRVNKPSFFDKVKDYITSLYKR